MPALSFEETLEDLSSRFIVNLPSEELSSIERICFQCEQAHWFYEDFLRPLNPSLPSLKLRKFSIYLLHTSSLTVPLIRKFITGNTKDQNLEEAFDNFLKYKSRVPVCGAILISENWDKCLLVRGWKGSTWGFPKGKINQGEPERDCAVREVLEETGYDCGPLVPQESPDYIELAMKDQRIRLYIVPGVAENYRFETQTRKEISKIAWFKLVDLPTWKNKSAASGKFYMISPFIRGLKKWVQVNKQSHPRRPKGAAQVEILEKFVASAAPNTQPVPAFPDTTSLFPTFASDQVQQPPAQLPAQPQADADLLRTMLGLGADPQRASVIAAQPEHEKTPGIGARMIDAQGDARGQQLLALLRGPSSPPPQLQAMSDEEAGRQALLSALHAGAGNAAPRMPPPPNQMGDSERLLAMLHGNSPFQLRAESPLLAPVPQKTAQSAALLNLISPQPRAAVPQVQPQPQSQAAASHAEDSRDAQRDALLARLLGGAPPPPPQQQQPPPTQHQQPPFQQHPAYYPPSGYYPPSPANPHHLLSILNPQSNQRQEPSQSPPPQGGQDVPIDLLLRGVTLR